MIAKPVALRNDHPKEPTSSLPTITTGAAATRRHTLRMIGCHWMRV